MRSLRVTLASLALALFANEARAGLVFDFQEFGQNQAFGNTQTFSANVGGGVYNPAFQITAKGSADLFAKFTNNDPGETGLGLKNGTDHEFTFNTFVDFNITSLKAAYNIQSLGFVLGSVTGSDAYEVYALNDNNTIAVDLGGGTANGTFPVPTIDLVYNKFRILETGNNGGNILVDSILVNGSAVPEPSSLALMGIAGAVGLVVRRARKGRLA